MLHLRIGYRPTSLKFATCGKKLWLNYEKQEKVKPESGEGEEVICTYQYIAILDASTLAIEYDGQIGGKGRRIFLT